MLSPMPDDAPVIRIVLPSRRLPIAVAIECLDRTLRNCWMYGVLAILPWKSGKKELATRNLFGIISLKQKPPYSQANSARYHSQVYSLAIDLSHTGNILTAGFHIYWSEVEHSFASCRISKTRTIAKSLGRSCGPTVDKPDFQLTCLGFIFYPSYCRSEWLSFDIVLKKLVQNFNTLDIYIYLFFFYSNKICKLLLIKLIYFRYCFEYIYICL